jgi:hypothetical protein
MAQQARGAGGGVKVLESNGIRSSARFEAGRACGAPSPKTESRSPKQIREASFEVTVGEAGPSQPPAVTVWPGFGVDLGGLGLPSPHGLLATSERPRTHQNRAKSACRAGTPWASFASAFCRGQSHDTCSRHRLGRFSRDRCAPCSFHCWLCSALWQGRSTL